MQEAIIHAARGLVLIGTELPFTEGLYFRGRIELLIEGERLRERERERERGRETEREREREEERLREREREREREMREREREGGREREREGGRECWDSLGQVLAVKREIGAFWFALKSGGGFLFRMVKKSSLIGIMNNILYL